MSYAAKCGGTGASLRAGGWLILSLGVHLLLMQWPVTRPPPPLARPLHITVRQTTPPPLPEVRARPAAPPTARHPAPVQQDKPRQSTALPVPTGPEPTESEPPVITRDSIRRAIRAQQQGLVKPQDELPAALKADPEPAPQTRLARGIDRSQRKDCRNAYAGAGLLALPILLKDTVTDTGCKW